MSAPTCSFCKQEGHIRRDCELYDTNQARRDFGSYAPEIIEGHKGNALMILDYMFSKFEQVMHNVLMSVLPACKTDCCRFHLAQSWCWKIQTVRLSSETT